MPEKPARDHLLVVAGLVVASIGIWWRVWVTGHPTSTITCPCGDTAQGVWFQAWTAWAIAHLHNPFLSHAIFAGQGGANMLDNTSGIFPAILTAPITWLFGPIASFNVAATLAPVVSGWAFFAFARSVTNWLPGQLLGTALWAFSPFLIAGVVGGHFQITWLYFPPVAAWALHELFAGRRHPPLLAGTVLGLATVAQFFTGTEVLAMTVVIGTFGTLAALALSPREAWSHRRRIATGLAAAIALAAVLLAYPAWFALAGPRHIVGPVWADTPYFGSAPGGLLGPGHFVHASTATERLGGYFGPGGPAGQFLGPAILVALAVAAAAWYRSRLAWVAACTGIAGWACSIGVVVVGPSVVRAVEHHRPLPAPDWWLPWSWLSRLPALEEALPLRFCLFTTFSAALLLTISSEKVRSLGLSLWHRHSGHEPGRGSAALWSVVVTAAGAALLIPIASSYTFPLVMHPEPVPAWFEQTAPRLPDGTVVLAVPYPASPSVDAMAWQAVDTLHFRLVGGYADTPLADGRSAWAHSPTGPTLILDALSNPLFAPPEANPSTIATLSHALTGWHVQVVVVTNRAARPRQAVALLSEAVGRAPLRQQGAWVWYLSRHSLPARG